MSRKSNALALALLAAIALGIVPALAQNPVDPTQSWVESNCNFVILTPPGGVRGSDFGDNGIVIQCNDASGHWLDGIPGSAMTIVALDGSATWPVTADTTRDGGRTLMTGYPGDSYTLVHGLAGVNIHLDGEDVLIDNGGEGFLLELRSPDLDGDGTVNLNDVVIFASAYGCCEDTYECLRADFDGDGCVGLSDLAIFERWFGATGAATADPEGGAVRQDRSLFQGCLQLDFGTDSDPETIDDTIDAMAGMPFFLRFVARDFDHITGTDFEVGLPNDLTLLARNTVPAFPLEMEAEATPGYERVVVSGTCATDGPLFIYEFMLMSSVSRTVHVDEFPFNHAHFSDCQWEPEIFDACIGAPTPCQMSSVDPGAEMFVSCPGGDLDTAQTVTVEMRDQDGQGVAGIPAAEFRVLLDDARGSLLADMVRFTPLANVTDADGQLSFRMELREDCRWDVCLDLLITVRHESCDLHARKLIRTINVAPAVSHGQQADAVIDLADVAYWAEREFQLDDCLALTRLYRCPVVVPGDVALLGPHVGCTCEIIAAPLPASGTAVAMDQNTPNPFNPRTGIRIKLSHAATTARVCVHDLQGRLVAVVHDGALPAGPSDFTWDGRDAFGRAVASGTYVASVRANGEMASVRMVLLR